MADLGSDDAQIADYLETAGIQASDLNAAEIDLTGDMQTMSAIALTNLLKASLIIARAPGDDAGNTILRHPVQGVDPSSCAQVKVSNGMQAIRVARLADAIAITGASEFSALSTQQFLIDMVREQRHY